MKRSEDADNATQTETATILPAAPSLETSPDPAALIEVPLAHYRFGPERARGGLGKIVEAEDVRLGRTVAIKELLQVDEKSERRFIREARLTARLQHPSIVPVHEAGRWPTGEPFYTMKMISGRSLKEAIADKSSMRARLSLLPNVLAVAEAIAYAHSRKVIHRDLKPSNILVGEFGETVVVDWGLAKSVTEPADSNLLPSAGPYRSVDAEDLTAMGSVMGTPAYMPPEQARGENVDERADVYALGAILYHLLSGNSPFSGTSGEVIAQVKDARPPRVLDVVPDAPADLVAIVQRAMEREPHRRYAHAGDFAEDLARFLTGGLVRVHDYSFKELFRRWISRNRALSTAMMLFLVLAALGTTLFLRRERSLRHEAEVARDVASKEAGRADRQTTALLKRQGMAEMTVGHPIRAGIYFARLLLSNPGDVETRYHATLSIRAMDSIRWKRRIHLDGIMMGAFSNDGRRVITASKDRTAAIVDASTGIVVGRYRATEALSCAAFSPDGSMAVVGTARGGLVLLDTRTATTRRSFVGLNAYVNSCVFSADGLKVLTVALDGLVSIWDVSTGERLILPGDRVTGTTAVLSSDGKSVLIATEKPGVAVYDSSSGSERFSIALPGGSVRTRATFCDLGEIATVSRGRLQLWDATSGKLLRSFDSEQQLLSVKCVRDKTSHIALVTRKDLHAQLWDLDSGLSITYSAATPDVSWASLVGDARYVATTSAQGVIRVFDTGGGQELVAVDLEGVAVSGPRLSDDGRAVLYATSDGNLYLADLPVGTGLNSYGGWAHGIYRVAYAADGKSIAVAHGGGVSVVDVKSSSIRSLVDTHDFVWRLRLSMDSRRVLLSTGNEARVYDFSTGELIGVFKVKEDSIYDCALSPNGQIVATADTLGNVRFWNVASGEPLAAPSGAKGRAIAFSADGKRFAVGDSKIAIWDLDTMKLTAQFEGHPSTTIDSVAFDSTGQRLISAGWDDHLAKIWDLAGGTAPIVLTGHTQRLMAAEFSPDGRLAATGAFDKSVKIWDAATGTLLRSIDGPIHAVSFSPDGVHLATGIASVVVTWDISADPRPSSVMAAFILEHSPWRLSDGELVIDPWSARISTLTRYMSLFRAELAGSTPR